MLTRHLAVLILFIFSLAIHAQVPASLLNKAIVQPKSVEEKIAVSSTETAYIRYEELEKLKNPRETMRTFINSMDEVKKGAGSSRSYFDQAARTFNLSHIDENIREMTGRQAAERLINTLDRITKIDFNHIPADVNGSKWYFRKQSISLNEFAIRFSSKSFRYQLSSSLRCTLSDSLG